MEKTPSSNDYTLVNLVELFKQGKFTEVLRIAQPMIDQNPNEINLINIFGAAAAITGQFQLAEDYLKRALELDQHSPELNNNMGNVLLQQKKYHQSVSHFQQAVQTQPGNCKFYIGLGIALMSIDRINDAEKVFKTAVSMEPKMVLKKLLHTVNFLGLAKKVSGQLLIKGSEKKLKNNSAEQ